MKLYSYWRSSSSWRVRIALAHKGLSVAYEPVHLLRGGGEQHGERYRSLNPAGTVPLLEEEAGGSVWRVSQSMAILEYLEERFPKPPLLPKDLRARARVRQYAEQINSGIQPYQNLKVMQHVASELKGDEKVWTHHWIAEGLNGLEPQVETTAGKFCVGDEVSLADVFLIPQLYVARRFGVELEGYRRLLLIEANCAALPAFQVARPERQPDAEH